MNDEGSIIVVWLTNQDNNNTASVLKERAMGQLLESFINAISGNVAPDSTSTCVFDNMRWPTPMLTIDLIQRRYDYKHSPSMAHCTTHKGHFQTKRKVNVML